MSSVQETSSSFKDAAKAIGINVQNATFNEQSASVSFIHNGRTFSFQKNYHTGTDPNKIEIDMFKILLRVHDHINTHPEKIAIADNNSNSNVEASINLSVYYLNENSLNKVKDSINNEKTDSKTKEKLTELSEGINKSKGIFHRIKSWFNPVHIQFQTSAPKVPLVQKNLSQSQLKSIEHSIKTPTNFTPPSKLVRVGKPLELPVDPAKKNSEAQNVKNEIVTTEKSYIKHVKYLHDSFVKLKQEFTKANVPIPEEFELDKAIESLKEIHHSGTAFIKLIDKKDTQGISEGYSSSEFENYCKATQSYSSNYKQFSEQIRTLQKESPIVKNFADKFSNKQTNYADLELYTIEPIQRIPRHVMSLNELLKKTEKTDPGFAALEKTLDHVKIAADLLNSITNK